MRARASLSKARKPVRVSPERHNAVLAAAQKRVDALEGRLASVVEGVIERAGARAAHRFELKATNHLTAAAGNADVSAAATMICVRPRPDEAEAIADPDGDAPETLHVTLAYLGKTDQPLEEIAEALRPVAASLAPLAGVVGGYGIFDPPGVGILLPDVRGLVELRVAVTEALLEARIDYGRQHGFEAHITVHSDPTGDDQDAALARAAEQPLHFDAIHVVRGNVEEVVIPLVGVPSLTAAGEPPAWSAPFADEIIDVDQLVKELLAKTDPVRKAMIEQTMTAALEQAGLSWDVTNPLTAKVLAQSASQIRSIAETTQLNVMRIVQSAYQNGLTIPQTATAIRAGMKVASKTRATLIARTELAGAANGGSLAATQLVAGATGENYSKSWRTAPGAKYPRHEDYEGLDGQTVPLDGVFQVGEDALQFPGDPDGDPGEICNCRCVLTYGPPISTGEADVDTDAPPVLDSADTAGGGGGGGQIVLPNEELSSHLQPLEGDDAEGLASSLAAQAKVFEPALTAAMRESAKATGAELVGLKFRLKSASSAARKIAEDASDRLLTVRETAYGVSDMVRYTAQFSDSEYIAGTRAMLADLQKRGLRITRVRNTWLPDAPYAGINVQVAAANGYKFELQFHTPASYLLKEKINHPLYEEWRLLPQDSPRAVELVNEMSANTAKIPVPPGARDYQFGQPGGATTEIGVTPFRPEDDPIGFYDSEKYKEFTDQVFTTADEYGVTVDKVEHMTGVWQGETEPSVSLYAHDGEAGLRAFSASLGKRFDQDGVLTFGANGPDILATFPTSSAEDAFAAMRDAGLDAGRLTVDGKLQIIGPDTPEFRTQLSKVEGRLGQFSYQRGSFGLLERDAGDYESAVEAFHSEGEMALRAPSQAVANETNTLDPTGKKIDAALESVGQHLSFPGSPDDFPALRASITGDPKIAGIPVEGVFRPNSMTIQVRRLTEDPYATFTHELGHALDNLSAAGEADYATESIEASGLGGWWGAVSESPTYRKIAKAISDREEEALASGQELTGWNVAKIEGGYYDMWSLRYALNPHELWARSFVQWLSRRDPILAVHVERELGRDTQRAGFWYWPDAEFALIDDAMTAWFDKNGLLRQ